VGTAWDLGKPVPATRRKRAIGRHTDDRFYSRQSTPLGIGRKRGEQKQAVGRSRGGRNTKIHALADAKGRLIAILLTGGEAHDCPVAERLIDRVEPAERMLGDKAYDSNELRDELKQRGTKPVIPNRINRKRSFFPFSKRLYKLRWRIESAFNRLKDFRRIATRYDKLARNYLASVCLAAALVWWI
jgi:transposase